MLLALFLTGTVCVLMLVVLGAQVAMNTWHRSFFDALEFRDRARLWSAILLLPALVLWHTLSATGLVIVRMLLQLRWREWVTERLMSHWMARSRYARLGKTLHDPGAPEFRIAEDTRLAIDPLVELTLGFVTALISAITFAAILWRVAGSITLELAGMRFVVPAYMAVGAVIYAAIVSAFVLLIGKPLVARIAYKNEREAVFRAEMTRLRDNAARQGGGDGLQRAAVRFRFREVVDAWLAIIRRQGLVGIVLNTNGALFPILPVLLVAPKYLSGALTLGAVMQVVAAFTAVQAALIWFVDNFTRIAEWYASVVRVDALIGALEALDEESDAAKTPAEGFSVGGKVIPVRPAE